MKHYAALLCLGFVTACTSVPATSARSPEEAVPAPITENAAATKVLTSQPVVSQVEASTTADDARGDVEDLMRLVNENKLVEMRTTYNGSYGASLFFWPEEATYYVALFQMKNFWRVLKVSDDARAEAIYATFVRETWKLAGVEIRRTKLQAQEKFLERVIALSKSRAKSLQADLDIAHEQQANVEGHQRATQAEAAILKGQSDDAQARLIQIQRQVRQLQDQTEQGLGLPGSR
jgi:hypothetical protein